jgi:hypothetical protein
MLPTILGEPSALKNRPVDIGNQEVIVRYKDPTVVNLGGDDGWLMIVARDLVRQDVANFNHYPPALTSRDTPDEAPCFPDSPGVSWRRSDAGHAGPFGSSIGSADVEDADAKCEYLADIVAFWSQTEDFTDLIGPFWIRPSLVTEAAPDEPDWDTGETHVASRPRYWDRARATMDVPCMSISPRTSATTTITTDTAPSVRIRTRRARR